MPPRYSPLQKEKLDFHKKCEEKNMLQFNELMTQYNNIQTNKQIIKESNTPKKMIKERKLEKSVDHVLSKIDALELEKMNEEDRAESLTSSLLFKSEGKKHNMIRDAEDKYQQQLEYITKQRDEAIKKANNVYEQYEEYLNRQKDEMKQKAQRVFDTKKRQLELRGENVKGELEIIAECKSAPEITIQKQEQKLLKEMNVIIQAMQMGRDGEPDWFIAGLPAIPTLPDKILEKTKTPLLQLPKINIETEESEFSALRQAEEQRIIMRERREQEEKQRRKEEQEEKYQASLEKTKAMDEENKRRLAIALEMASKKQEEEEEDDWSEEAISKFCNKKIIEINPAPNSPRSEAILQDLIKSLNTPA